MDSLVFWNCLELTSRIDMIWGESSDYLTMGIPTFWDTVCINYYSFPFILKIFSFYLYWRWMLASWNLINCPCLILTVWNVISNNIILTIAQITYYITLVFLLDYNCFTVFDGGFTNGSDSKESACNAGDLGSIPALGRSPGERNGYPL